MDGIADMGGTSGWGPARPPKADKPVFAEPWQGRVAGDPELGFGTRDAMVGVAKVATP